MDKNFRQITLQVKSSSQIIYVEAEEFSRFRFHRKRTACQNDDYVIPWTGGQFELKFLSMIVVLRVFANAMLS